MNAIQNHADYLKIVGINSFTQVKTESTPLRCFLESIPVGQWAKYRGITVDHRLGFQGRLSFHTVYQLMNWLGHNKKVRKGQRMPYQSWMNRHFNKPITKELFESCCAVSPNRKKKG